MPVMFYDGHTHELKSGAKIRHVQGGMNVTFDIESADGAAVTTTLTLKEAFRLGLSLLRDYSLGSFGIG